MKSEVEIELGVESELGNLHTNALILSISFFLKLFESFKNSDGASKLCRQGFVLWGTVALLPVCVLQMLSHVLYCLWRIPTVRSWSDRRLESRMGKMNTTG